MWSDAIAHEAHESSPKRETGRSDRGLIVFLKLSDVGLQEIRRSGPLRRSDVKRPEVARSGRSFDKLQV